MIERFLLGVGLGILLLICIHFLLPIISLLILFSVMGHYSRELRK